MTSQLWKRCALIVVVDILVLATFLESSDSVSLHGEMRLCGKRLVTTLVKVCSGCVNGIYKTRFSRSHPLLQLSQQKNQANSVLSSSGDDKSLFSKQSLLDNLNVPESIWSVDDYKNADPNIPQNSRKRRNVADECCMNQCSYRTLRKYCCR